MTFLITTVEIYTIQHYILVLLMWPLMLRRRLQFKI